MFSHQAVEDLETEKTDIYFNQHTANTQSSSCWTVSIFLPNTSTNDGKILKGLVVGVTGGKDSLRN